LVAVVGDFGDGAHEIFFQSFADGVEFQADGDVLYGRGKRASPERRGAEKGKK
jgi:hypothetical protein